MQVSTKYLFDKAYAHYGIAAVNVFCMEQIHGLFSAAQESESPFIVQITPAARNYAHKHMLISMIEAAHTIYSNVVFSVHLDHGTVEHCIDAIASGNYNSIMIDASHEAFQKNIAITKSIVEEAHKKDIMVEAELGVLSGVEDDIIVDESHAAYTNPKEAKQFVEETRCDSLAVAVGTSHGAYKFSGKKGLQHTILKSIQEILPKKYPLILHGASEVPLEEVNRINQAGGELQKGASGLKEKELHDAIQLGVCKVNIATDTRLIWARVHREFFKEKPAEFDLVVPGKEYMDAYKQFMIRKFESLNATGKNKAFK